MNRITILIADDHKLIREFWAALLAEDRRFYVIGLVGTGNEAVDSAARKKPDIVLMDINMPGMDGFDAAKAIKECSPLSKIIGASMHTTPAHVKKLFKNGATGYVSKTSSKEELLEAILAVAEGKSYICAEVKTAITAHVMNPADPAAIAQTNLSRKELEIIGMVREGLTSIEMAERKGISPRTVEVHRYNIFKKLKVKNTAELVNFAAANGIG